MVKNGDFIRVEYTGHDGSGSVFDSTKGEIAKRVHGKEGPLLIVLGVDYIVGGMAKALLSMKKGEEKEIVLAPEEAFGKREQRRVKVIPLRDFRNNELAPYPGAVIQMDTGFGPLNGLVKSVNSGRVLVDFNHPLAGQTVRYQLRLVDVIEDAAAKINSLLADLELQGEVSVEKQKAVISLKKGQAEEESKKQMIQLAVKKTIPEVKEIEIKIV